MKRAFSFSAILATLLLLAGCGGGSSDNSILDPGGGPLATPSATTITLLASSPQFPSDQTGLDTLTLTAIAKDGNNNSVSGVAIVFDAGGDPFARIDVDSTDPVPVTAAAGILTAQLSNGIGGAVNRTIIVRATDAQSGVSATLPIVVTGTTLTVEGAPALAQNDSADYTVVLSDSKGNGIPFEQVTVTSATGNTINASTLITDGTGKVTFTLTATAAGADTVTVTALGETTTQAVSVSNDQFTLTNSSAPVTDIPLAPTTETITLTWTVGGVAQAGQTINFNSTRGTLSASSAVTNGAGQASVTISSTTAGPSSITASNATGTSTTLPIEFVATNPTQISVQAAPFTLGPGQSAEILSIVRDAQDNLVKNQLVNFLILADDTNGFLTAASAITDSQGRASTFYTGGQSPGAENGVQISATVSGTAVTANVSLTVAQSEFDFVIGTGNDIFEPTTASFSKEWNIIVTDSVGNAVQNTPVQVSLRSLNYYKGQLLLTTTAWVIPQVAPLGPPQQCVDEDGNRNGILDLVSGMIGTGEDAINGSGQMEAGNVATVAPVEPDAPANDPCTTAGSGGTSAEVITNSQGIARVCVIWPQNFSLWVDAQIEALSTVSGSESSQAQVFRLPALASDMQNISASPPNQFSPFGTDLDCTIPPPGLPLP
ncbi:MAG: Ig-like domain-containing protein [Gammaproteobacteria bacterium]